MLAYYGREDLDVATVRGDDRRITRWIAKWALDALDDKGRRMFAGVRYLSRLDTEWECWAVFDDVGLAEVERGPITRQNPDLLSIARDHSLTVH